VIEVRHTDEEIEQAARRFEQLADGLVPATAEVDRIDDLRQIAAATHALRRDEARLREGVETARANGRSWNQVALALGVTRQAARQRYTNKTQAGSPRTEMMVSMAPSPEGAGRGTGMADNKRNIHTVPTDDGWANRREGGKRASSTHDTKAEAQAAGRAAAKKDGVEHLIHKKDGTIGDRNSYGNDPHPPKG